MEYEEFRKSILYSTKPREHSITNSLGVRDAYNWIRKNKWFNIGRPLKHEEFYKIIRTVNNLMAEELTKGKDVTFPCKMGQLEVRKYKTYVKFIDGELKTNRLVDWKETLKLWYEDEEARENKTLVKREDSQVFVIFYNRMIANYNNKTLCLFRPTRTLKVAINEAGKKGVIDAYQIGHDQ